MKNTAILLTLSFILLSLNSEAQTSVSILKTNGNKIKKFEKFEAALNLRHVMFQNSYDHDKLDVWAAFKSP